MKNNGAPPKRAARKKAVPAPVVQQRRRVKRGASGYYESTNFSRMRNNQYWSIADWNHTAPRGIRNILMSQARHLAINSGEIRGLLQAMVAYSVGTGLRPQSRVKSPHIARSYDEYFDEWAQSADFFNGTSFWEIQRQVCAAIDRDGDVGVAWTKSGKLQLYEAQDICDNGEMSLCYDGVEYDRAGRPVGYITRVTDLITGEEIWKRHLAGLFSLIFVPERPGASRGVSALAHGVNDAEDFRELMSFAKLGLKQREAIGFVIQSEEGVADPLADPSATFRGEDLATSNLSSGIDTDGDGVEDDLQFNFDIVKPGCVPRLRPNEKIEMLSDSRPSNSFNEFVLTLLTRISIGMGVPLEILWAPSKSPTGPAMRSILTRAQTTFDTRANAIERLLCVPVWKWVIGEGILRGDLRHTKDWQKAKWSRPSKLSIDAGRDAQASIAELAAGTQTLEQDSEMRGLDWRAIRTQRVAEAEDLIEKGKEISEKHGIDLKTAMGLLTDVNAAVAMFQSNGNNNNNNQQQ